jgi:hypothetical protein|tara:strand:- start:3426 stop:3704 length:279 start_codon:yes stop_codon:yes gene_type:complete
MANSDVKSKRLTGTGAASVGRSRLRQVQILTSSGGAGRLTLTDGNGGATILDIDFLASDSHSVNIPDEGLLFTSDIHVATATNVTALTLFHS